MIVIVIVLATKLGTAAADTAWREMESVFVAVFVADSVAVADSVVVAAEDLYSLKSPQSMWNPYDSEEAYSPPPALFSAVAFFLSIYRELV
jgi:hypothetical protein